MSISVLEREMFSEPEAARLLDVPPSTLHYWLEGGERRDRRYQPVIRTEARGDRPAVTWAEFIEAGLLRQYRKRRVPMAELRAFIDRLRAELDVPYPLADRRPYIGEGRRLLSEAQEVAKLHPDFYLVAVASDQLVLTPASDAFFERVDWEGDTAAAWRPHDDPRSPVRMVPDLRFGRPAVNGISTEIIWEHAEAGEDVSEITEAFDLGSADVHWALAYENSMRDRAA